MRQVLAALLTSTALFANALVTRMRAEHRLGAISVAVVQDGRIAYSGVAGDVERGRPADASTVFRGASLGLGREEGCEGYAVAFLERGTAFVTLSESPLGSTFTGPLAAALLGDSYSSLDWLEFR